MSSEAELRAARWEGTDTLETFFFIHSFLSHNSAVNWDTQYHLVSLGKQRWASIQQSLPRRPQVDSAQTINYGLELVTVAL